MHNEKGRSYGSKTETKDKEKSYRKIAVLGAAAVAIGIPVAVGMSHDNAPETSREEAQIALLAEQNQLDKNTADGLLVLQNVHEGIPAALDAPALTWKLVSAGDIAVTSNIETDAINEYKNVLGLGSNDEIPESASNSMKFTESVNELQHRNAGESTVMQPGETFGFSIVVDQDGNNRIVISDSVKPDTE